MLVGGLLATLFECCCVEDGAFVPFVVFMEKIEG
jgi:hypothetical protein